MGLSLSISTSVFAARTLTIKNPTRWLSIDLLTSSVLVDPSIVLDGGTIEKVICTLKGFAEGDTLVFTTSNTSSDYTFAFNSGILTITDPTPTAAEGLPGGAWETLLRTLRFTPGPVSPSHNNDRTVEYEVLEKDKSFKIGETYHFYDFVAAGAYSAGSADGEGAGIYWNGAKADAESSSRLYYGKRGYLATVTSVAENNFLFTQVNASDTGWLGGSDISTEGTWLWKTGPEAGTAVPMGSPYWNTDEPNNSGGEDYLQTLSSSSKKWNDLSGSSSSLGYFIEWGGLPEPATTVTIKIQNHNAIKHAAGF